MIKVRPAREPIFREPIFNMPGAVAAAIGFIVAVHLVRAVLSDTADFRVLLDFAFFPAEWTVWFDPDRAQAVVDAAARDPTRPTELGALARYVTERGLHPWSVLSYALLHGSWAHLLLNCVWLAAFGTPVTRRCGPWRFVLIAILSAIGGAAAHLLTNAEAVMPVIGASASVSGLMGAAAYFVFTPPYEHLDDAGGPTRRKGAVARLLGNRTALLFLGLWFASNLLFGLGAAPLGMLDAGVAWQAHVGGLLTGLVVFPLIDRWSGGRPGDEV